MSMGDRAFDIAVIGGWPAGLSAEIAARQSGASVVLIDAFEQGGGQYCMQPVAGDGLSAQAELGRRLVDEAARNGVEALYGHEVIAAYPGFRLLAMGGAGGASIGARAIIAANGAHDRVVAFPGWTLPGVMTAGAGQRLAKVNGVLPGNRIVLAGSGVFLWAVAESLLDKGAEIVALIEARRPQAAMLRHLVAYPERWPEAWRLFRAVRRRIPRISWGHVVANAGGTAHIASVSIAPVGGGAPETISGIDALLVSHGFQPNIDVTSLLDCHHEFSESLGGWHAMVGIDGQSSVPGVYAAGEVTGVSGARPALISGEIAGLSAARGLGYKVPGVERRLAQLLRRLRRERRFGRGLGQIFAPLREFAAVQKDETILCRCEDVSRSEILAACRDGTRHMHTLKTWTRAGMGHCQGRMCRMSIAACASAALGVTDQDLGYNRARVPLRPVNLEELLSLFDAGRES